MIAEPGVPEGQELTCAGAGVSAPLGFRRVICCRVPTLCGGVTGGRALRSTMERRLQLATVRDAGRTRHRTNREAAEGPMQFHVLCRPEFVTGIHR